MTAYALPSYCKIQSMALGVRLFNAGVRFTPARQYAVSNAFSSELWAGSISFAPMSRENAFAAAAFFERLRQNSHSFYFDTKAGFDRPAITGDGTIIADALAGASVVNMSWDDSGTLPRGTLLGFRGVTGASAQVCEVLRDVTKSSNMLVPVAPRIRFDQTTAVSVIKAPQWRFNLAGPRFSSYNIENSYGTLSVEVVEAIRP